jgi:hypothetical protein
LSLGSFRCGDAYQSGCLDVCAYFVEAVFKWSSVMEFNSLNFRLLAQIIENIFRLVTPCVE